MALRVFLFTKADTSKCATVIAQNEASARQMLVTTLVAPWSAVDVAAATVATPIDRHGQAVDAEKMKAPNNKRALYNTSVS